MDGILLKPIENFDRNSVLIFMIDVKKYSNKIIKSFSYYAALVTADNYHKFQHPEKKAQTD